MTDKERIERLENMLADARATSAIERLGKRVARLEGKLDNMPDELPRTKPVVKSWREILEWTLAHVDTVKWGGGGRFDHTETGAMWDRRMWDTCGKEVEPIDHFSVYRYRLIDGDFHYLDGWVKYV